MWKALSKTSRSTAAGLLLLVSLSALPAISCGAETMGPDRTVTITMTEYMKLRQNARQLSKVQKQEIEKWNLLSASQKQQAETLNQQREEIENSQKEMAETRQSLERANSLLKKASESLENQKKSYQKLTEETESVLQRKNHEIVVAKRQRDAWAIGAGLIGIFGIVRAVSG
ncbi:hypothetical protein [uncultured Dialister sp.]|uniref:hypothetical protein n=1 Tax=uncultured Dialister sp. TaxID=278064 RepID=UPI0027DC6905|nr:hypothetical protein [uncultured Dialister sp.]